MRHGVASLCTFQCARVWVRLAGIWDALAMTRVATRNVFVLAVMVALGTLYFSRYASTISKEWILVVNFILAPAAVGLSTYFLFAGKPLTRVAFISAIPVLSILLTGGDPAKPGLEIGLIAPLLIACWLGAGVSFALQRFIARHPKRG